MALVVKVFDQNLKVERALKLLPRNLQYSAEARVRHEREAQLAAQLEHPHVVPVHDFFEDGDQLGTVMSLARGSLVDWVQQHGLVPQRLALEQMIGVLDALEKAHELGIIHRDIKPSNLLIDDGGRLQLADFGIAQYRSEPDSVTKTGATLGSLAFMPPEQRTNSADVDGRSDLYAFAGTLLWMLTYKTPLDLQLDGGTVETLSEVSESLSLILSRATARNPDDRYQSTEELRNALQSELETAEPTEKGFAGFIRQGVFGVLSTLPPPAVTEEPQAIGSATKTAHRPSQRHVLAAFIALAILLTAGITWQLRSTVVSTNEDGPKNINPAFAGAAASPPITNNNYAYDLPECADAVEFNTRPLRKLGGRETLGSTLVDLDRDGYLDAIFVQQYDETTDIYWGSESGQLGTAQSLKVERTGSTPAVGDIDGNGQLDLAFTSADNSKVSVYLAEGPRKFGLKRSLFQDQRPVDPVLVHLNQDEYLDLAFLGEEGLSWRAGDGKGGFREHSLLTPPIRAYAFDNQIPATRLFVVNAGNIVMLQLRGELFAENPKVVATLPAPETAASPYDRHQLRISNKTGPIELLAWEYPRAEWILKFSENADWKGCMYAKFERQRIGGLGDWSADGILDLVSHRTCAYCTSNHEIRFGRRLNSASSQAESR